MHTIHMKYDTNKLHLNHFYMCPSALTTTDTLLILQYTSLPAEQIMKTFQPFNLNLFGPQSWYELSYCPSLEEKFIVAFLSCIKIIYQTVKICLHLKLFSICWILHLVFVVVSFIISLPFQIHYCM